MNAFRTFRLVALLALLAVSALLTACNTVEGLGEDFSAAGQSMADAAHKTNPQNK